MPFNWTDQQIVVYTYNGIPLNNNEEGTSDGKQQDESQKYYDNEKRQTQKPA